MSSAEQDRRFGLICGVGVYIWWGLVPLYFKLVGFADPLEVVAWRTLFSIPAAVVAVTLTGGFAQMRPALQPRMLGALALSALFVFGNWALFVWAVAVGRVVEAALAYFLVPLFNAACGVALFGERLRPAQWTALGLAAFGVVIQTVAMGAAPWVSIALCITWGCYGLVRKQAPIASSAGLLVETIYLIPVGVGLLLWLSHAHGALAFTQTPAQGALLALLGPLTAIPLIFFSIAARRLPFNTLGLLQFIAPSLTFLIGVLYGEPFTLLRMVSFGFIWGGLFLYSWDALRRERPA